ncbi:MAG TPA: acetyl-CoA carboxylase biotin carboxylase subunit [Saprospiraceae bacterium]|nr:acetyl-CoA carboxylase biotin carboxylase subunit [Saprospiraceae bacterium]
MNKILIANRGEIACRIIQTARKMGIATVAVFSDADQNALHVRMADEAYHIGASPSAQSYLQMDKIIEVAEKSSCDGIHPGYGFLSENAAFSEKVKAVGIKFIGPSSHSIEVMGSKLRAKEAVKDYGIPLVPGTDEAMTDIEEAKQVAKKIGFPILIKASAGGGGKGMRLVESEEDFEEQLERAQNEARSAFGDDAVFIEKFVEKPRHIEIQVLVDAHGKGVHLFERECSIQRRHQKVIEEAPSSVLNQETRQAMGADAVKVAKACDYEGAGTVEFLYDKHGNYYFLEMNTRLQVEHPVTEMITGLDLVEQQINIARGESLPFDQEDIQMNGHAFELRIYAEDPFDDFVPSTGTLERFRCPDLPGVRLDTGYLEGMDIPIYYDPMIAKLVVYAENRNLAAQKMRTTIQEFEIRGIAHTLEFGSYVFNHEAFLSGDFDTKFVDKYWSSEQYDQWKREARELAARVGLHFYIKDKNEHRATDYDTSGKWWIKR